MPRSTNFTGKRRQTKSKLFLDTDPTVFVFILDYLRNGRDVVLPQDAMTLRKLERDAQKFGLRGLLNIIERDKKERAKRKEAGVQTEAEKEHASQSEGPNYNERQENQNDREENYYEQMSGAGGRSSNEESAWEKWEKYAWSLYEWLEHYGYLGNLPRHLRIAKKVWDAMSYQQKAVLIAGVVVALGFAAGAAYHVLGGAGFRKLAQDGCRKGIYAATCYIEE